MNAQQHESLSLVKKVNTTMYILEPLQEKFLSMWTGFVKTLPLLKNLATTLLTTLGLGSVAVGLAFKDIFENFFAGVLIMLRRSMNLGDYVEFESVEDKVEFISIPKNHIRQADDQLLRIPTGYLFRNPVTIPTDQDFHHYDVVVGVAYG